MADKDKTPAKKKAYTKPTVDRLDDSDLRDVTGGEDVGCSSPGGPSRACRTGGAARRNCDSGGSATSFCNPGSEDEIGRYCKPGIGLTK